MKELISSILEVPSLRTGWHEVMDDLPQLFGAKTGVILGAGQQHECRDVLGVGSFFRVENPEIQGIYETDGDEGDDEVFRRLEKLPIHELLSECVIYGLESPSQLPASGFREELQKVGLNSRAAAVLNPSGPWFDMLALFYDQPNTKSSLTTVQSALLFKLISKMLQMERIFRSLHAQYNAVLVVLDHLGLGVLLLDEQGHLLLANYEGRRLLDEDDGVFLDYKKKVKCRSVEEDGRFQAAVAAATGTAKKRDGDAGSAFGIPRLSGQFDILTSVLPLSDAADELQSNLNCAFVLMIDPAKPNGLSVSGLSLIGRLTKAESLIADELVKGKKVSEIAEIRDTSTHTVRTQIKSISAKLRCHSQSDIIRLAAATRLPIEN